jgi:hypothetical protein
MSLGTSERMEFLISGKVLHEMGVAENHSALGEICLSKTAYDLIENDFDASFVTSDTVKITGLKLTTHTSAGVGGPLKPNSLKSSLTVSNLLPIYKKRHRVYVDTVYDGDEEESLDITQRFVDGVTHFLPGHIENRDFKLSLIRYVHESVRKFNVDSTDLVAEIRMVSTLFIQILNLTDDFDEGRPQRPQQVLLEILDIMKRLGGALRQYVVDDKGCVVICNFGVAQFSSNNDPLRAVSAAMSIRDHLNQINVICRIGVTQGMAFCGYVGSKTRKEYTVMGSSVNLAARLMSKANPDQILVDTKIFLSSQDDFEYQTLPKIEAKGYTELVQVYSPLSYQANSTLEDVVSRSSSSKVTPLVGRSAEIRILSEAVMRVLGYSASLLHPPLVNSSSGTNLTGGGIRNKQMSLRATLSQIIEESSTKNNNSISDNLSISPSPSFNFDEKLFSPRTVNVSSSSSVTASGGGGGGTSPMGSQSAHTRSHSTSEMENAFVVVGGPGYGKTALINQVIARNATVMCPTIRINCHVSSIYEPYEVIGNLLEELMSHASLPPAGTNFKLRRNSSPKRRRRSVGQDLFRSISEEDETGHGGGGDSPSSSYRSANEDPEALRKQANENLFQSLSCWIEYNMPDTLFEYISNDNIWKGGNSSSTQRMDCKDEDNGIPVPHLIPERVASCLRSRSSRRFSVGSVNGVGVTIANKTKVFTALEVMSLLRVCFDTEEIPSASLLSEFTSNGLEDMISSILSEVISQLLASTKSKCMVIEDLHWCDKRSFDALMLTLTVLEPDSFFLGSMRQTESVRRSVKKSYAPHILSSEGSISINSIDDLHVDCQILELHPFTKTDVRHMIQNTIGSSILLDTPNILSDENISRILSRSNSVPCEVAEQIKEMEMNITRSKYGIIDRVLSHHDGNLLVYDELSKESQILMKIAAVCGMTFSVALLHHTLTQMGYTSLVPNLDRSISLLEDKLVFKRVHHNPDGQQDSPHSLVSVKSRLFRTETSKGFSFSASSSGASTNSARLHSRQAQPDPKKRFFTFLNKSFRETIYSLMLSTQRMTAHAIIGDYLSNEYQDQHTHDCQDAETLAFHYSRANDLLKEVYYTVEAAKLFQKEYKISTAYQHFHQLVVLSTRFESIETILQHCTSRAATHNSYYEVFVKTFFNKFQFGQNFNTRRYLKREEFLRSVSSLCDFIPNSHLSNFIAEMSILKYK